MLTLIAMLAAPRAAGQTPTVITQGDFAYTVLDLNKRTVAVGAANTGITGIVKIPAALVDKTNPSTPLIFSVVAIVDGGFRDCQEITAIKFEGEWLIGGGLKSPLTSIGNEAFANCTALERVGTIPMDLATIGEKAFAGCTSLAGTIAIPQNVKKIEASTFYNCSKLEGVELPGGLESIGAAAFQNCQALKSVNLPTTLTAIGASAFYECRSLEGDLVVPAGIKVLERYAFNNCFKISSITLPEGLPQ